MLDSDLAELYGVETKKLLQSVKRNIDRFPEDFMFQLEEKEWDVLRSQFVTSKEKRGGRRYLPYAFTEQGVAMLSSVLRSKRAIAINIEIIRAFVELRRLLASNKALSEKIEKLEEKYDSQFKIVFDALRKLISPSEPKRPPIGFKLPQTFLVDHPPLAWHAQSMKVIFFDIDNTLLNHDEAMKRAVANFKKKYFPEVEGDVFLKSWKRNVKKGWALFEANEMSFLQQGAFRIKNLQEEFGGDFGPDEVFADYMKIYHQGLMLFDGVKELLENFSDTKLGIISNGAGNQQRKKLISTGLIDFFEPELIFISEELGHAKPDMRVFDAASKAAATDEQITFIGDNFEQDITPASQLGWRAIWVDYLDKFTDQKGHQRVRSVEELHKHLI